MVQLEEQALVTRDRRVRNGLLFIPDISGFTELVHSTDVLTGKQITFELLSAVIGENDLELNIAEVEGDAILFYRYGEAPSSCDLAQQYAKMAKAFETRLAELQKEFSMPLDLSLKVIAHYGPMTEYKIGGFKKLYGEVVVEAHRLLKNSIESDSYLLLTDSLLELSGTVDAEELLQYGVRTNRVSEVYGPLGIISFTYFDFTDKKIFKQVA